MYRKGEVEIEKSWTDGSPIIQLPHSCDAWEIGGPAEVRLLIADLEAAIKEYEAKHGSV